MRDFLLILIFTLLLLTTVSSAAKASVTIIPLGPKDKQADDFPYVGSILNKSNGTSGSGAVVGDGTFVLTAKHVITHNGFENGMLLDGSNFEFHLNGKLYVIDRVYGHSTDDIAILKLTEYAGAAAPLYDKNPMGKVFYGVGFGKSSSNASYESIQWDVNYGTKRVYKNTFTWVQEEVSVNGTSIVVVDTFGFLLRKPDTLNKPDGAIDGEGMHGPGDSGGPALILDCDTYKIAGIMASMTTVSPYAGYMSRIDTNLWWIKSIIQPEVVGPAMPKSTGPTNKPTSTPFDWLIFGINGLPEERKKFQLFPN